MGLGCHHVAEGVKTSGGYIFLRYFKHLIIKDVIDNLPKRRRGDADACGHLGRERANVKRRLGHACAPEGRSEAQAASGGKSPPSTARERRPEAQRRSQSSVEGVSSTSAGSASQSAQLPFATSASSCPRAQEQ